MSAFTLSNLHISAMVRAMNMDRYGFSYYWQGERHQGETHTSLGQKLLNENYRSVNYRYSEETEAPKFEYNPYCQKSPVEIIKLCDCYEYQTCETPDWKETEAYAIYTALREVAINALPGMSDAAWSI